MLENFRMQHLLVLCLVLMATALSSEAASRAPKPAKVSLRFLARGSAIYSSFSGAQTEYLVEIVGTDKTSHFARLLYRHALTHPDIPELFVDSGSLHLIHLTRSTECDESYEILATRWLPGEYGLLRASAGLRFIAGVSKPAIAAGKVLPCYLMDARNVQWRGRRVHVN